MKKVYDYQQIIFVKTKHGFNSGHLSCFNHYRLLSDTEVKVLTSWDCFDSFESFYKAVEAGLIWNCTTTKTFFRNKPEIRVHIPSNWTGYITERNFEKIRLEHTFEELPHETMENLMKNLRAEDFIEYLKERGISNDKQAVFRSVQ